MSEPPQPRAFPARRPAPELAREGAGVRVGVIDSGWDRGVADPRVARGVALVDPANELELRWSDDDHDRNGHGTAAADLILQVAPRATIVPIRVFGAGLETSPHVLAAAIEWAASQRLHVANLSLGTSREDALVPLYRACERARRAGTILVAAAADHPQGRSFPAAFEPVIGVQPAEVAHPFDITYHEGGAFEAGGRAIGQRARGLGGGRVTVSGTSFAAPVVAGWVARLRGAHPAATLDDIRGLLAAGAARHA